MRKILFSIITVFCLSFFFFLFTPDTYAVSFPADYDVTYTIGTDGVTQVRENIVITNETDTQYPSQYTLALEGVSIENIQAADGAGVLETIVEDRDDFTLITVNFNEIVIGRGNQLSWSLQYQSADIVEKKGTITEVSLPQIQPDERISSYRITVISPVELGELDYSDPLPVSYERDESTRRLSYSFENPNEPISVLMAFGTTQLVDMELHYHLENTQHDRGLIEVALPPSQHPYQKIYISSLEPEPYNVEIDTEGNILARYLLDAGEQVDVVFKGQAHLNQKTIPEITQAQHQPPDEVYLKKDTYWEIDSAPVQAAVQAIYEQVDENASDLEKAQAVYSYVVNTMQYDVSQLSDPTLLERSGAAHALNNPDEAICTDFTDTMITILRAMGIPSREINGYAFTDSDEVLPTVTDVLHAWVQVYIPEKGWIQVDPTWGSTADQNYFNRFDTNHITFVIKGLDSEYPYPAGSYKITGNESEDVFVSYADIYLHESTPITLWAQQLAADQKPIDFIDWLFLRILRWL